MVFEVLSPNPRIGRFEDRLRCFAEYGVPEIWIYRQPDRRLDIVSCRDGHAAATASFTKHAPIRWQVLPKLSRSTWSMLG